MRTYIKKDRERKSIKLGKRTRKKTTKAPSRKITKPKRQPDTKKEIRSRTKRLVPPPLAPHVLSNPVGRIKHVHENEFALVRLMDDLKAGDSIMIKGSNEFTEKIKSLRIEGKFVRAGKKGQLVEIKFMDEVEPGDKIFKIKR